MPSKTEDRESAEKALLVCFFCGRKNFQTSTGDGQKRWFLKFTFRDGEKVWTCPGGNHSVERVDETEPLFNPSKPGSADPSWGTSSTTCEADRLITQVKADTLVNLGVDEDLLTRTPGAGFILDGVEVFAKGVRANTHALLLPGTGLRSMVDVMPNNIWIPIYMGVGQTIERFLDEPVALDLPVVLRGFMATFSMVTWDHLVEAGVPFDPGDDRTPHAYFQRLGIEG